MKFTLPLLLMAALPNAEQSAPGTLLAVPDQQISGILNTAAAASAPVALIVGGMGDLDRDGNRGPHIGASTYRFLAEALVRKGVSVARFDKRRLLDPRPGDHCASQTCPFSMLVDDAEREINLVRAKTGAQCLWLIGHSEGGLVSLLVATRRKDVCGLILLASPGRPMLALLREQIKKSWLDTPSKAFVDSLLTRNAKGQLVDVGTAPPAIRTAFSHARQRYLIEESHSDPRTLLAGIQRPVMILQGKQDLQVFSSDAVALHKANRASTLVILPNIGHQLRSVKADDRLENIAAILDRAKDIPDEIPRIISSYILKNPGIKHTQIQ